MQPRGRPAYWALGGRIGTFRRSPTDGSSEAQTVTEETTSNSRSADPVPTGFARSPE